MAKRSCKPSGLRDMLRRTRMTSPSPKPTRLPLALALGYVVLFVVAVPWYWGEGGSKPVLGMPLWAVVSVGVSFMISCLTAWAAFRTWPSDGDDEEGGS